MSRLCSKPPEYHGPVIWRGTVQSAPADGSADVRAFRRAVYNPRIDLLSASVIADDYPAHQAHATLLRAARVLRRLALRQDMAPPEAQHPHGFRGTRRDAAERVSVQSPATAETVSPAAAHTSNQSIRPNRVTLPVRPATEPEKRAPTAPECHHRPAGAGRSRTPRASLLMPEIVAGWVGGGEAVRAAARLAERLGPEARPRFRRRSSVLARNPAIGRTARSPLFAAVRSHAAATKNRGSGANLETHLR